MKLILFDLENISIKKQEEKVIEEFREWLDARDKEEKLEETWDLIQASIHYLCKYTKQEILRSNALHIKKLKTRARKGLYKIISYLFLDEVKNNEKY